MAKLKLIIGTYNSEPPESTADRLEKKYQNSYKPFLKVLYGFPKVRVSLHFSGLLLEWFEQKHPEIILVINEMIKRRQLELLGGGFYSPVLPLIPAKDRINQIELLTTYIRKKFGRRPRGFWLTEHIWEPFICSSIHSSGMNFTFLEESQFKLAGLDGVNLFEPCYTEDQGKVVTVLPVHSSVTETAGKLSPEDFIDNLARTGISNDNTMVSLMFDGSSFGENVNGSGEVSIEWFEKFFSLLTGSYSRYFSFVRAGDYVRSLSVLKKVYFPVSSGSNIDFWALSTDVQSKWNTKRSRHSKKNDEELCCPRGYFRQFLSKYEETNLLYSKMLFTHNLVSQVRSDKSRKKSAGEEILKSQIHYPYWHGKYLGFYDPSLRQYSYKALITSEKNTREKGKFTTNLQSFDFDMDGGDEYLYRGQYINVYIHKKGGRIFELDYMVTPWNYLNTIRRYPESYHTSDVVKDKTDRYSRDAFLDHFLDPNLNKYNFISNNYVEDGDFLNGIYSLEELDREHKEFTLSRDGTVKNSPLKVVKRYNFKKNYIEVTYRIVNTGKDSLSTVFGCEINLSFFSPDKKYLSVVSEKNDSGGGYDGIALSDLKNKVLISLNSTKSFNMWDFPVYSITKNGGDLSKIYQYNCYLYRFELKLESGEEWENTISIKLEKR